MGLLVFVRNLLLALCLFLVLGFLYYSAWKLHLLQWEDSSKYGCCGSPRACRVAAGVGLETTHCFSCCGAETFGAFSPTFSLHAVADLSLPKSELSERVLFFHSNPGLYPHSSFLKALTFFN